MNDYIFGFERLQAFITGRRLVKAIYDCQKKFPAAEKYALGDQIRRASVSITSNIAEGMGRISPKEQVHFIEIAYGSLMETYSQLLIALDENYITADDMGSLKELIVEEAKLLSGLRTSLKKKYA